MTVFDLSQLHTRSDLHRLNLQIRARSIVVLKTLIAQRREDWSFYLSKRYMLDVKAFDVEKQAELVSCFEDMKARLDKLRQDISNVIALVRETDQALYNDAGVSPEQ